MLIRDIFQFYDHMGFKHERTRGNNRWQKSTEPLKRRESVHWYKHAMEARKKKFEYQLEEEKLSHETDLENKLEEEKTEKEIEWLRGQIEIIQH